MTLKLRRPVRVAAKAPARKGYATGGGVYIAPIKHVGDDPEPAHVVAARRLDAAGIKEPTGVLKGRLAAEVTRERQKRGGSGQALAVPSPSSSGLPTNVQAALALPQGFARGGSVSPYAPMPLPSVATPGLASPRGMLGAHHRQHFAGGGVALPPHVLAALALRPHFEDGGEASGGDRGGSSSSGDSDGGNGSNGGSGDGGNSGDGHGNSDNGTSSGSAGGVGGFGGGSSDGYGGGSSSSSSSSSGSAGGVGGFGGGADDGYGGGSGSTGSSSGFGTMAGSAPAAPSTGGFSNDATAGGFSGPASTDGDGFGMSAVSGGATPGFGLGDTSPAGFGSFGQGFGRAVGAGYGAGQTANEAMRGASLGDDNGNADDGGLGMPSGFGQPSAGQAEAGPSETDAAIAAARPYSFTQPGQIPGAAPTVPATGFSSFGIVGGIPGYTGMEATNAEPGTVPDAAYTAATPNANAFGILSPEGMPAGLTSFNPYTGTYAGWSDEDESGFKNPDADTSWTAVAKVIQTPDRYGAYSTQGMNQLQGFAQPDGQFTKPGYTAPTTGPEGLIDHGDRFGTYAFARGGAVTDRIPTSVRAALALRRHFEDGGDAGSSDHSSSSSSSGGSDNGGDGHGNSDSSSSSSSSSGSAGGVGGFGGGSSDGYGSSSSSSSSGSAGGVGGFGGSSGSDGYGGSSSSGSNSNTSSGSAGGVGGFGGSSGSDGYGSGSNSNTSSSSTQSSGGFSSGAASGSDGGGDGGSVGAVSGSSATSGPVGSISGSYGAPAAGGFSSEGSPATGGFGSFGAGPAATSNPSGLTGVGSSASMMSGQTAGQSMANEAANSAGEAGEDGTGSVNGVSTAGAFGSFGTVGTMGPGAASPYGNLDSARSTFGAQPDGTTGAVPGSVAASNPQGVAGLSPAGGAMGIMGMGGVDPGLAGSIGAPSIGAYGLSTMNPNGNMPGFDNFSSTGSVQQSSLGDDGFTGYNAIPGQVYSTPGGMMDGAVIGAVQGTIANPEGYVGAPSGLSPNVPASVAAALAATTPSAPGYAPPSANVPASVANTLAATSPEAIAALTVPGLPAPGVPMPGLPDYGKPFTPDFSTWNHLVDGVDQTKHPGYVQYGPNGPIGAPSTTSDVAGAPTSPYGAMPANPFGTTNPTSATPGLNADGDPVAVGGVSALTIHGNISPFSGATAGDLSPSGQAMSDGVPTTSYGLGLSVSNATAGTFAQRMGAALALGQDAGVPSFSSLATNPETSPVPTSLTGATTFAGTPLGNITDAEVFNARQNIINGIGTQQDQDTINNYLAQQNTPAEPGLGLGTPSFAAAPTTPTAPSVPNVAGLPAGAVFGVLHTIEGGVLDGQQDPKNPKHYGPAQFSQDTFSDTARAHPGLGIDPNASMFGATAQQYADATQAHWGDIGAAITAAGLPDTPGNRYLGWNLGITGGLRALRAGPDASLEDAGISPTVQAANPSIYGYKDAAGWHAYSTVGQVQANLASRFAGASSGTTSSPSPSGPGVGLGLGLGAAGTFSPSGVSFGQPGEDSTGDAPAETPAPAAPVTRIVTSPAPYSVSPGVQDALATNGLPATPTTALAVDTLGVANGIAVLNAPRDAPISDVDISPATVQAHPELFSGVRTLGDLQDKIAAAAPTAGTTTSTVTEPGTPTPSTLTISPAARQTQFSNYTGADGDSPSFGLNTISAGVPTTVNNAGTYGVPTGVGLGQDAQNLAGYSQVPSSVPTLARGILASPGFSPETGFSTDPGTPAPGTPSTGGPTVNGPASPADGTSDPTTPDGAPAKHLSVPDWAGNGVAGFLAGSVLGPVGSLLGFGNTVSGWLGGPTAADGINAILAHPGQPGSVTGSPTSASNSTTSNSDALQQQNMVARVTPPGSVGDGSGSTDGTAAASTGVSPYDPHADAMAAYQAALAGMNRGSGTTSSATDTTDSPRPLLIRGRPVKPAARTPLYRPMEDPIVRRALGLE